MPVTVEQSIVETFETSSVSFVLCHIVPIVMFEWMCHDKSESNARMLPNLETGVIALPRSMLRVGRVVQDATLIRDALRIPIQRCFNPPHLSETRPLAGGGSPQ